MEMGANQWHKMLNIKQVYTFEEGKHEQKLEKYHFRHTNHFYYLMELSDMINP